MTDPFEELIQELGRELGIKLHIDPNRACALRAHDLITIQIQQDREDGLLLACLVSELPPGRFRENVFAEALKTNSLPQRIGIFGYLPLKNSLTLHHTVPLALLNGKSLAILAGEFIEIAEAWHTAIRNGRPNPPSSLGRSKGR